jgi:hypothetical protein
VGGGEDARGRGYYVSTDNPENARRARAIAQAVGGTVASAEESDGRINIVFAPSRLQ